MNAGGSALVIVSGLSGSGKSVALKTFEDLDYYCTDNLPVDLLPDFVRSRLRDNPHGERLAVGIDVRGRSDLSQLAQWRERAQQYGIQAHLLFFDASDEALLKRYADTRRRHPLSHQGLSLPEAIARERELTEPLRQQADAVIDTSALNVHQLRRRVITEFALSHGDGKLSLLFESFAYKRGVPAEADFVFDARVLPNPHWEPELRPLTGRDAGVRDYLEQQPDVVRYVGQITDLLDTWLPRLRHDTRSYVTVAFGCTGGKHRSVYLAERMARHAREQGWPEVATFHRELD
ncbi:MAG TPA: RNase adapter RapZ [Xanthomonadaceae bacterium]|nr:RNase adapter RapZ [Xanthomonadaceae bacterium]